LRHLFRAAFDFLQLDVVFAGQPAQRVGVGKFLVFDQKGNGIAPFAAAKTFKNVAGGVDVERGRLFIMKRAESQEVDPAFAQRNELSYDVFDPEGVKNFLDLFGRYHNGQI